MTRNWSEETWSNGLSSTGSKFPFSRDPNCGVWSWASAHTHTHIARGRESVDLKFTLRMKIKSATEDETQMLRLRLRFYEVSLLLSVRNLFFLVFPLPRGQAQHCECWLCFKYLPPKFQKQESTLHVFLSCLWWKLESRFSFIHFQSLSFIFL